MGDFNRKPIALFRQVKKSTNLSKLLFDYVERFQSKKLQKLVERFREQKAKRSNLLSELKRAYPANLKIGASISEGDCFFDSVAQGLNELNIKPGHRFTAKSLREDCESYARANKDPSSWVYQKVTKDAEEGGYFVGEENLDGKVIEKGRNSEDEKGIPAQTDWGKNTKEIIQYTEDEFFSWLQEEYCEDRKKQILEILKSRYGADNDFLQEDNDLSENDLSEDEYEKSEYREETIEDKEEIREDGKEKGEKVTIKQDNSKSFSKYLENIKNIAKETNSLAIWGRPEIEGRMICEKYQVKIEVIALEEELVGSKYTTQFEQGEGDKVVRIVNYMRHFVPLLSGISKDIEEDQPVSNEEIFDKVKEAPAPTSDQPEQEVQHNTKTSKAAIAQDHKKQKERIDASASESVDTNRRTLISNQSEKKPLKERTDRSIDESNSQISQNHEAMAEEIHSKAFKNTEASQQVFSEISEDMRRKQPVSSEETLDIGKRASPPDQLEQKAQYNTRTSRTAVSQDHTDKKIPFSHQPEQKTQQKGVQKKLINNCKKEAVYGIVAVIAAIVFTASAIAAIITQAIPFACLAGIALVAACVCVYQLTQSHKNINELKSELEENSTLTFLEEIGLKMHGLINKAILKI